MWKIEREREREREIMFPKTVRLPILWKQFKCLFFLIFWSAGDLGGRYRPFANTRPFNMNSWIRAWYKTIYENTSIYKVNKYLQVFSCEDGQFFYPLFFSVIVKYLWNLCLQRLYKKQGKWKYNEKELNCLMNKSYRRQIISRTSFT